LFRPRRHVRGTEDSALATRPSVGPPSPHHDVATCEHDIGARFNDKERFDIEEYCISEGWVKVPADKSVDRFVAPNHATSRTAMGRNDASVNGSLRVSNFQCQL
jgi:hypothetical protein